MNVPTPRTSSAVAGSSALGSEELMATVPEYAVAMFMSASRAVTANEIESPAMAEDGIPESVN